jgi:hypothetical protein
MCKNLNVKFKVCKSVLHRTFQVNHQPDATIFQFIILTFVYSSTGFGRYPAHHQERSDCSGSLWFLPSYRGDSRAVFVVGPAGPTTNRPLETYFKLPTLTETDGDSAQ